MRTIADVEIFKVGRWGADPHEWTRADLDQMAQAAGEVGPPLVTLGHFTKPAHGWCSRLHREGDALVADLVVTPEVYAEITSRAIDTTSAEIWRQYTYRGRTVPLALTVLALLRAPEVGAVLTRRLSVSLAFPRGGSR